jgi:NAD(P)-dependent dehydrogenase (short-subunit alcohol dehydrogenase family)
MKSVWPCAASSWRMIKSLGSPPILPSQFFFARGVQMVEGAAAPAFFALRSPRAAVLEDWPLFCAVAAPGKGAGLPRMGCGVSITAVAEASRRPASPHPWQKAESTSCRADLRTAKTFSSKNATRGAGDRERGAVGNVRDCGHEETEDGHIINVSSVYVHKVGHAAPGYCATKFAMRALSDDLRQEAKPYHIRTTVISPDAIVTELAEHIREPEIAENIPREGRWIAIPADSFEWSPSPSVSRRTLTSTRFSFGRRSRQNRRKSPNNTPCPTTGTRHRRRVLNRSSGRRLHLVRCKAPAVPVAQPSRIHLQIGELGSATILNTSCAFVLLLIVLQKLDDHFQIP